MVQTFTTHTGRVVKGKELKTALNAVANDWAKLAQDIYAANCYAEHVSEETKQANLARDLARAETIRAGEIGSFTIAQRVNEKLTGECVPLFSK